LIDYEIARRIEGGLIEPVRILSKVQIEIMIQRGEKSRRSRISFAVRGLRPHFKEVKQPIVTLVRSLIHEDSSNEFELYTPIRRSDGRGFDDRGILQSGGRRDVALQQSAAEVVEGKVWIRAE
jgi:hypothetical protein